MKIIFSKFLHNIYYSFPIQLFILHWNKHLFVLLFWIILFLSVSQSFGVSYGIPLLFLDPEYVGHVNFLSFVIVGFSMGGFIMAWNMSFYVLNSYRFEFLASQVNPFVQFCWNNFIIPFSFVIVYIVQLVKFQHAEALLPAGKIVANVIALLCGNLLMIIVSSLFFVLFNHDVETFLAKLSDKAKTSLLGKKIHLDKLEFGTTSAAQWQVEKFIAFPFSIKTVRNADFYDKKLVAKVLSHHHRNAILFQCLAICGLLLLGKLMDNPYFRLPASSAIFLIFSVLVVFFSFLSFWFRTWRTVVVIVFFFILNILTQYDLVVYKHKLYGLNYSAQKISYNNEVINNAVHKPLVDADIIATKKILENWKKKMHDKYGETKPKMLFVNTAGGGLKAAYWTFYLLQQLENKTQQKLFDHTMLMTGASGGMIGAAYFRELYLQQATQPAVNYLDTTYLYNIGLDLLNGMATSIATNDIFYPWQSYSYGGYKYKKDRAYMFDKKLNENTNFVLSKLLLDYKQPETKAQIPMMILSATIINDQRFLFFSPQSISYLIKPYIKNSKGYVDDMSTDAIEFRRFFKTQGADSINFIDALRTNATYPYIMPAVYLPTTPEIKAMDAGIRENSGLAVSTRFYSVFKDWIDANTSGVVFLSFRVDNKLHDFTAQKKKTYLSELLSPVGSIFNNFILLQDYNSDVSLAYLENASSTDINVLNFNYDQTSKRKKASMSWHLTTDEKRDIKSAFYQKNNQLMLEKLNELLQ